MSGDLIINETLDSLFDKKMSKLQKCKEATRAYIVSVLKKYTKQSSVLDDGLIGMEYLKAVNMFEFAKFQEIGDWVFFVQSNYPNYFEKSTSDYYISIGRGSYYRCYKILNKKWPLFEELADNFSDYSRSIYVVSVEIQKSKTIIDI